MNHHWTRATARGTFLLELATAFGLIVGVVMLLNMLGGGR